MNGYFLVEAIEEALGIFDARRRIPQPSSSAFYQLNRVGVLALRVQRIARLPEKDRRKITRSSSFSIPGLASFLFISPPELGAEARKAPMVALHRPGGIGP